MTVSATGRLVKAAGVRPGEGPLLVRVALLFAALEAGRGFGEVGVDTLVVSRLGATVLPYLFIGLGITSLLTALGYGAALGRLARTPLLVGLLGGAATILLAGRVLMAIGIESIVPVLWLVVYASGAIGGTIAWTVAGSVFDARQSKRLFPLCTGAAIAGSFVGTVASGPLARVAGTELLVVIEAVLLIVVGALIVSIARTGAVRVPPRQRDRSVVGQLRVGFDEVVRSPLFRLVAIAYVLFSVLYFSVTYPFLKVAAATFTSEADLATAIGLLSAAITATSFVVSLTLANRLYARFGVAGTALILPVVYVIGFGVWLVQFSFATAALLRFTQQVAQRGLSNAAWSAFYNVVPAERRAQVLAFTDGVPGQLGMVVSGFLLLGAGRLFAETQIFWLGAATAIVVTVIVATIRRRYGASLVRTLRAGLAEQVLEGGPGLDVLAGDPQVADALIGALGAPEPGVRQMAAAMLGRTRGRGVDAALRVALHDDDAAVRATALDALTWNAGDASLAPTIEALSLDPDAGVRAAAVRVGGRLGISPAAHLRDDKSPQVRAAVALSLRSLGDDEAADVLVDQLTRDEDAECRAAAIPAVTSGDTLLALLDDDSWLVRERAAAALSARTEASDGVISTLEHGSARAQEAALRAVDGQSPAGRAAVSSWAERQIAEATRLRSSCRVLRATSPDEDPVAAGPGEAADYLVEVLERRQHRLEDRALGALAALGAPEARGVIRRCLRADDAETRAQAIEALDSVGDRRLGGAIVRLIEGDSDGSGLDRDEILRGMTDDEDPWIRALARRSVEDGHAGGDDQSMPETSRTLGDLETMLTLRRVPLFEDLDPEDLMRVAATAVERTYPPGEAIMREGDLGDELVVIVEGSVRVVRIAPDGSERFIRTYEAGDHIGELAVLRERPRAATVIAQNEGVRGLVIGGAGLKSILRERPEAAMALLSTLAERISNSGPQ